MIDIKLIRDNPELVRQGVAAKGVQIDIEAILALDTERRKIQVEVDALRQGRHENTQDREAGKQRKAQLKAKDAELNQLTASLEVLLRQLPNLPRPDVKVGPGETENEVLRQIGARTEFSFTPKDYLELAKIHDLLDIERAGKVSGSRFGYLKNEAALLELALVQYGLSIVLKHGFSPVIPPVMVGERAMAGMGYLEHGGEAETYHLPEDKLYLTGTSEQSLVPMHMDETLAFKDLPVRYAGFSTCFRREAGSYGKDTRGILRVHQFDKLEMVVFTTPENSDVEHEQLLAIEEELMQGLQLPYQVVKMCTGDLGDPAARKYDIETWMPSENKYRETHSCSTCTDFQSRRLNIRYKREDGKPEFVHVLNGTVVTNRVLVALLENYQQADSSIVIPEVLRPFMGGRVAISKA